jgi:hypothetical protein
VGGPIPNGCMSGTRSGTSHTSTTRPPARTALSGVHGHVDCDDERGETAGSKAMASRARTMQRGQHATSCMASTRSKSLPGAAMPNAGEGSAQIKPSRKCRHGIRPLFVSIARLSRNCCTDEIQSVHKAFASGAYEFKISSRRRRLLLCRRSFCLADGVATGRDEAWPSSNQAWPDCFRRHWAISGVWVATQN